MKAPSITALSSSMKQTKPTNFNSLKTYVDDRPLVSKSGHSARENLRHEIRGNPLDELVKPIAPPVIEITGLELLMMSTETGSNPEEDESFESFARDSMVGAKDRLCNFGTMLEHLETHQARRTFGRRLSNCSSIGQEDDSEILLQKEVRRSSVGSYANDSLYRGGRTLRSYESSNDSSLGKGSHRRLASMESAESSYHFRQRRLSVNTISSYANDSIDYKPRIARRGSMDSYANDSVFGNNRSSSIQRTSLYQQQHHQNRRFSGYSDFAVDSVEAIRNSNDRKKQLVSGQSNHETYFNSPSPNKARRQVRRASMTNAHRPRLPHSGLVRQSSMTNIRQQSNRSLMRQNSGRALVKQCSSRSILSFSQDMLETQSINTNGASRAA